MTARASSVPALACLALTCLAAPPAGSAPARSGGDDGIDALIDGDRASLGKPVRLTRLRCADTGGGGLVCKTEHKGRIVALDAKRTGGRTSPATARRFSTECIGLAGFDKPACTFDVEVTPSAISRGSVDAGRGKRPLVTVDADSFDLF